MRDQYSSFCLSTLFFLHENKNQENQFRLQHILNVFIRKDFKQKTYKGKINYKNKSDFMTFKSGIKGV